MKKKDFFQVENLLKIEISVKNCQKFEIFLLSFEENPKNEHFFFNKSRFFDQKLSKNPKNSKKQAKIENAMNFPFSLR